MLTLLLPLMTWIAPYFADETISGYADPAATYHLEEMNGAPFAATATIAFPREGEVIGSGPCNRFSASQSAPYPWFALGPVAATRRACPELALETEVFSLLSKLTLVEVAGPVLILSNTDGDMMVFRAR